jgi:MFS family permease
MTAPPAAYPSGKAVAWLSVSILLAMVTVSYLDRNIISLMVEPIRADLGVSDFQIGLLQGIAFGAFYALCGLPLGWLVDRFERRWVIFGGVSLWSWATMLCGMANGYAQLLLARFGVGIGEASLSPAAYSMIADLFPRARVTLAISVFGLGTVVGSMSAFVLGGLLISHLGTHQHYAVPLLGSLHGWQLIFVIAGLPGLIAAFLIFLVPEPARKLFREGGEQQPGAAGEGLATFLRTHLRYFLCHFLGFSCMGVQAYATGAWLPVLMMRHFHVDAAAAGSLMGLVLIAGAIPGFLWSGWFIDRWFAKGTLDAHLRYCAYTCAMSAIVGPIAFGLSASLWVLIPLAIVVQFVLPSTGAAGAHLQIVSPPRLRGRVSALYMMVFNLIGMGVGPTSVGFITDYGFGDPAKVHISLAIVYGIAGVLGSTLFFCGLASARAAVTAPSGSANATLSGPGVETASPGRFAPE